MSIKQEWKDEIRVYSKGIALVLSTLVACMLAGYALESAFGDAGKVLYGAICWAAGWSFMPWVVKSKPELFR